MTIDIAAVSTDAATRATAWLTQALPAEPTPQEKIAAVVPVTEAVKVAAEAVVPSKPGLADAIRQNREQRAATQAAQAEAGKTKSEVDTLRKEVEALRAVGGATDPFEFLRGRKLTKEQQALWGQAFLYDLKPEVAPQEFRLELYKAEQARKEADRAALEDKTATEQAQAFAKSQMDGYANELYQHVQTAPGSSPESELWFTEDGLDGQPQVNHRVYTQSLVATAKNLAIQATKNGQQADLSPANVARVLEAEVAKRLARRDAKRASSAQAVKAPGQPAQGGKQAADDSTTSAAGLRSGAPLPEAKTEAERQARAAAVLFGTK